MRPPRGGGLWVRQENGTHCARPNKQAAGFTRTAQRRAGHAAVNHWDYRNNSGTRPLLRLAVHGTLDTLAGGYAFAVRRVACSACGSRDAGHLALTENGRARLAKARHRAAVRGALAAYRLARDTCRAFDEERATERLRGLGVPAWLWNCDTYARGTLASVTG